MVSLFTDLFINLAVDDRTDYLNSVSQKTTTNMLVFFHYFDSGSQLNVSLMVWIFLWDLLTIETLKISADLLHPSICF